MSGPWAFGTCSENVRHPPAPQTKHTKTNCYCIEASNSDYTYTLLLLEINSNSADVGGPIVRGNTVTVLKAGVAKLVASILSGEVMGIFNRVDELFN